MPSITDNFAALHDSKARRGRQRVAPATARPMEHGIATAVRSTDDRAINAFWSGQSHAEAFHRNGAADWPALRAEVRAFSKQANQREHVAFNRLVSDHGYNVESIAEGFRRCSI